MSLTLSGITLGSGLTLQPAFDPQTFDYTVDVPDSLASLSVSLAFNEGSTLGKPRYVGQTVSYDYAQLGYFNENDELTKMAIKQATVTTTSAGSFEASPQMMDIPLEGSYVNARIEVYSTALDQSQYYRIRFNRI